MCMKQYRAEIREQLLDLCFHVTHSPRRHGTGCNKLSLNQGYGPCVACASSPSIVLGVLYFIRHPQVALWGVLFPLSQHEATLMSFMGTSRFAKLVDQQRQNLRTRLFRAKCPVCKEEGLGITFPFIEKDLYNPLFDLGKAIYNIGCPRCNINLFQYFATRTNLHSDKKNTLIRDSLLQLKLPPQQIQLPLIEDIKQAEKLQLNSNGTSPVYNVWKVEDLQKLIVQRPGA